MPFCKRVRSGDIYSESSRRRPLADYVIIGTGEESSTVRLKRNTPGVCIEGISEIILIRITSFTQDTNLFTPGRVEVVSETEISVVFTQSHRMGVEEDLFRINSSSFTSWCWYWFFLKPAQNLIW